MIKISAIARFATLSTASTLAFAVACGQEDSGPWTPPPGTIAGPSSTDFRETTGPGAGSYAPVQGSFGEAPPRTLAPVYRGPEQTSHVAHGSTIAFDDRPMPGRPPEERYPASNPSTFAPPAAALPARIPAPLPPAGRSVADLDSGFVAPSAFASDVPAGDGGAAATDHAEAKRPLPPKPGPGETLKSSTGNFPYAATFGSLAAVLGAFFIFVWFQKRGSKRGVGALPPEVVEPLGTIPFVSRQALHVVRFGSKILLVNVTISGSETLAEIDDPREAERILALCRRHRPDSLGRTFREVLGSPRPAAGAASNDRSRGTAHA